MKNYFFKVAYFFIICIISMIIWIYSNGNPGYERVFILPLTYGILFSFTSIAKNIRRNVGILIFNVVAFIRYVVLIYIGALCGFSTWRGISPSSEHIQHAIWLMLLEMVCVFIFIKIFSEKYYSKVKVKSNYTSIVRMNSSIIKLFIILGIVSMVVFPDVLNRFSLITNLNNYTEYIRYNTIFGNAIELIVDFTRLFIVVSLIAYAKQKYDLTGKVRYVIFSIIIILLNLLIVRDLSRFSIFISSIAGLFFLVKLFGKYRESIVITVGMGIILSITIVSLYKFFEGNIEFDFTWWSDTLQMYFAGPKNVGIAISMTSNYDINPVIQILRDVFSSVAGVAGNLNQNLNSVSLYNITYYGSCVSRDQIIPLLGQGVFYFGYIGCIIPSLLSTWIMMWFDYKAASNSDVYSTYVYYFMAAWFGAAMMINWAILFSHFINTFVFMMIIIKINKLINLKKSVQYINIDKTGKVKTSVVLNKY